MRLFVAFEFFIPLFKQKAIYNNVSLPAQKYYFISEKVNTWKLQQSKQAKAPIFKPSCKQIIASETPP